MPLKDVPPTTSYTLAITPRVDDILLSVVNFLACLQFLWLPFLFVFAFTVSY